MTFSRSAKLLLSSEGVLKDHVYVFNKENWVNAFWSRLSTAGAVSRKYSREERHANASVCGYPASLQLDARCVLLWLRIYILMPSDWPTASFSSFIPHLPSSVRLTGPLV